MNTDNRYQELLNSSLHKIADYDVMDDFWAELSDRADQHWYLHDVDQDLPSSPAEEEDIQEFIIKVDTLLRRSIESGDMATIEVDDATSPTFIKFHSNLSLNGKATENWILSLDEPTQNGASKKSTSKNGAFKTSEPNTLMEKGGPLLRWFSNHRSSTTSELADPNLTTATNIPVETLKDKPVPEIESAPLADSDELLALELETDTNAEVDVEDDAEIMIVEADQEALTEEQFSPSSSDPDETQEIGYLEQFDGRLIAIRNWKDLDELWASVHGSASDGWHIYIVGETPPNKPSDSQSVHQFLLDIDTTLRQEHKEDYCGIVYADNTKTPSFIKIYDPQNLGMVCGSSDTRTLPGWTISKVCPTELLIELPEEKIETRGFKRWKGLFGRR